MYEIRAEGLYGEAAAALVTGVSRAALVQARRAGNLEFRRIGPRRRIVYRGSWLLAWLLARETDVSTEAARPRPGA